MGMEVHPATGGAKAKTRPGRYDISMRLLVRDPARLWRTAVAQALSLGCCTGDDVEDMFGPMEDPSITDCIAMLVGPADLAGCSYEEFSIAPSSVAAGLFPSRRV